MEKLDRGRGLKIAKKSLSLPPPLYVRVNTLKIGEDELRKDGEKKNESSKTVLPGALEVDADYSTLLALPEYQEGLFYPSGFGFSAGGQNHQPLYRGKIIDVCWNRGKALTMAQYLSGGEVFAWDKKRAR